MNYLDKKVVLKKIERVLSKNETIFAVNANICKALSTQLDTY